MAEAQRVDARRLIDFAAEVLRRNGVPDGDAELVADSLVQADLWGHQSHGIMRLSWYVDRLRSGAMKRVTAAQIVVDSGAVTVLDGHDGVGQVLAAGAMKLAIDRSTQHGVAAVGVRNSNHFGTAAYFTRMAPSEGCIGMLLTNASPAMAPWGGKRKAVGNNPWSVAAPSGRFGVVAMDIAMTAVARGKIYLARQKGERIPLSWATDSNGVPTGDPEQAIEGLIQPMGEHKGYAIALMLDVLAGVLTGSSFGAAVSGPYQAALRSGCGHLAIVLRIGTFLPLAEFQARMDSLIEGLKSVPTAPGFDEIHYPGEIEDRNHRRHLAEGLTLPAKTMQDMRKLARDAGVAAP
jgi:LDH2 family malate/lactate/ureidoglycolate dehydrogenase